MKAIFEGNQFSKALSLREYMALKGHQELKAFNLLQADACAFEEALATGNILAHFRNFLREGFRPIFLEDQYQSRIKLVEVGGKQKKRKNADFVIVLGGNRANIIRQVQEYGS